MPSQFGASSAGTQLSGWHSASSGTLVHPLTKTIAKTKNKRYFLILNNNHIIFKYLTILPTKMQKEIIISTKAHNELIDITKEIEKIVSESKVKHGLCNVFTMHKHDKIDNNAAAHIKASIIGPSETIPIKDNKLDLGTWQSIAFCEFDGPRTNRKIIVTNQKI